MCLMAYLGANEAMAEAIEETEVGRFRLVPETSAGIRKALGTRYAMRLGAYEGCGCSLQDEYLEYADLSDPDDAAQDKGHRTSLKVLNAWLGGHGHYAGAMMLLVWNGDKEMAIRDGGPISARDILAPGFFNDVSECPIRFRVTLEGTS